MEKVVPIVRDVIEARLAGNDRATGYLLNRMVDGRGETLPCALKLGRPRICRDLGCGKHDLGKLETVLVNIAYPTMLFAAVIISFAMSSAVMYWVTWPCYRTDDNYMMMEVGAVMLKWIGLTILAVLVAAWAVLYPAVRLRVGKGWRAHRNESSRLHGELVDIDGESYRDHLLSYLEEQAAISQKSIEADLTRFKPLPERFQHEHLRQLAPLAEVAAVIHKNGRPDQDERLAALQASFTQLADRLAAATDTTSDTIK